MWIVISLGFILATFLLTAKVLCSEKQYPNSLFNMNYYWVTAQCQFIEKFIYTHTILRMHYLHGTLLLTICLYSSLPLETHQSYSSQKQDGKNSKSFFAKANQFIRKQTPLTNLVMLLDPNRSQPTGISEPTRKIICSKINHSTFYEKLPTESSSNSPQREDNKLHLLSLFPNNNLSFKRKKKSKAVTQFKRPIPISRHRSYLLLTALNFYVRSICGSLLTTMAVQEAMNSLPTSASVN